MNKVKDKWIKVSAPDIRWLNNEEQQRLVKLGLIKTRWDWYRLWIRRQRSHFLRKIKYVYWEYHESDMKKHCQVQKN